MFYLWHDDVCQDDVDLWCPLACQYVKSHTTILCWDNCSNGEKLVRYWFPCLQDWMFKLQTMIGAHSVRLSLQLNFHSQTVLNALLLKVGAYIESFFTAQL